MASVRMSSGGSDSDGCIILEDSEQELISDSEPELEDFEDEEAELAVERASDRASYRVVDAKRIGALQQEIISRAVATLACTDSEARIALRHHRWNFDRLMEAVAERGSEAVFTAAGAISSGQAEVSASQGSSTCMVCMEDLNADNQGLTMSCGHTFCKDCWMTHITIQVHEGSSCNIKCMAHKCGAICSQPMVVQLLTERDPAVLAKYNHAVVTSYIEDNSNVRWCPSVPCCENAVEVLDDGYCEPRCACGTAFCFKCGEAPHSPATCSMWQQWQTKLSDDSETVNYMKAHVKPCPKCSVPVEKNGGCNLVMCRSCRQTFCWLCGAKTGSAHTWERIDGHTCGAWKEEQDRQIEDSKARHKRYMHYFNHFTGHLNSFEQEKDAYNLKTLVPELSTHVNGAIDWSYLAQGQSALLECRRVLSRAYVFAFFMFEPAAFKQDMTREQNGALQALFEDSMATLTSSVELLSDKMKVEVAKLTQALATATISDDDAPGGSAPAPFEADGENLTKRLELVNLSVNIDKRIRHLFERTDKDIVSTVSSQNLQIAPYRPVYAAEVVMEG